MLYSKRPMENLARCQKRCFMRKQMEQRLKDLVRLDRRVCNRVYCPQPIAAGMRHVLPRDLQTVLAIVEHACSGHCALFYFEKNSFGALGDVHCSFNVPDLLEFLSHFSTIKTSH